GTDEFRYFGRSYRLDTNTEGERLLARLAHVVARHRYAVIGAWLVLTLFGGFAAGQVSKRWFQSFSIPGRSAYETNQRTLNTFGVGVRPPNVLVFHTSGDATKSGAIRAATQRVAKASKGALTSSYFSTGSLAYVSKDRHTTFMEAYPPGLAKFDTKSGAKQMRSLAAAGLPAGTSVHVTGHDPLEEASTKGSGGGPSVLLEAIVGGFGALIILLFVFGTLPAILMPIVVAIASILNTFTLVWALTYLTDVSIIVQFLIALVGIGGMLIPAVSVLAAITLLPAMLAVLGTRINSVRVLPKRFVDRGHPEDGFWGRWARFVLRHPWRVAIVGTAIVAVLAGLGTQLTPNEAQLKNFPGAGDAIAGRSALAAAHISPGVMKPFNVLVENGGNAQAVAAKLRTVPGVAGAVAPKDWHRGSASLIQAFPSIDGAAPGIQRIINRTNDALKGTNATLGGVAAVDRDFIHAIYGN